jgi:hypothetical protein
VLFRALYKGKVFWEEHHRLAASAGDKEWAFIIWKVINALLVTREVLSED